MTYFPLRQTTCFFIPLVAPCKPLLISAKHNNSEAVMELYKRCQPTIKKYSYVNGKFDEDLYQNLVIAFLGVIEKFK